MIDTTPEAIALMAMKLRDRYCSHECLCDEAADTLEALSAALVKAESRIRQIVTPLTKTEGHRLKLAAMDPLLNYDIDPTMPVKTAQLIYAWSESVSRAEKAEAERDHLAVLLKDAQADACQWMAQHADMKARNALLRQRPDLPVDRIPAHDELVRLQAAWDQALERIEALDAKCALLSASLKKADALADYFDKAMAPGSIAGAIIRAHDPTNPFAPQEHNVDWPPAPSAKTEGM